jgi:hypothetical protein
MMRAFLAVLGGLLLSGCWIASVDQPDPAAIPTGPPTAMGPPAQGPVIVVGTGRSEGFGWRYSLYESTRGTCTQLELVDFASTGGGDLPPTDGGAFGSVGTSEAGTSARYVEGIVGSDVADLFVEMANGERQLVALMSLEPAGYEEQAFVAFMPQGATPDHLVAEDADGMPLGTFDISNLGQ